MIRGDDVGDLVLDTDQLRQLGADLRLVAEEFTHANNRSDDVADDVGHDDLADAIREFAHNWDDKREKMVADIGTLAEAAIATGEVFEQLETDLVASLEDAG